MAPGIPGFAKEVVWTVDWHGDIGTCSSCWRNFYSRMAFLRQPTLWDGVFLTRHAISKNRKIRSENTPRMSVKSRRIFFNAFAALHAGRIAGRRPRDYALQAGAGNVHVYFNAALKRNGLCRALPRKYAEFCNLHAVNWIESTGYLEVHYKAIIRKLVVSEVSQIYFLNFILIRFVKILLPLLYFPSIFWKCFIVWALFWNLINYPHLHHHLFVPH